MIYAISSIPSIPLICQGRCNALVSDQQLDERFPLGATFADRLNYLFDARLSASGKPFTNKEVSVVSGGVLSPQYISQLRRGEVTMPGLDKIQAFAQVFGVPETFFFEGASTAIQANDLDEADLLREAARHPVMREILLESREYTSDEWAVMLDMMRYARAAIARGRTQEDAGRRRKPSSRRRRDDG